MSKPLISVVMVVCNADRFLAESIESILGQTLREFEFIIVDFGSTDRSKSIVASYAAKDSRAKLHEIDPCRLTEARNAACFLAQGDYIAMMDADDVADRDRLQKQVAFMQEHPEVGLVGGATEWIDSNGRPLLVDHLPTEDREIRAALAIRCPFCQPTVLLRSQAFTLVGGYRTVFTQAEDYDLWLRIAAHFRCANLSDVVLKYRIHPFQISIRKREQQTLCFLGAQIAEAARKSGLPDPLDQVTEITSETLVAWGVPLAKQKNVLVNDYLHWIRHMRMAGEYSIARSAALEILQSDLECVERWQIADLHLLVAGLMWRDRQFLSSLFSTVRALVTRPLVAGRPLKSILRGFPRV